MISDWFYDISNWRWFQIDLLGRKFWCRLTAPMLIGGGITGGMRIMHMMVIDEMGCHDKMKKIFFDQKGRMIIWLDDKEGRWIKTSEEGNWKFKGRRQSSGDHLWLQRWGLGGTQSQGKQGKRLKGFKWALPVWGRCVCVCLSACQGGLWHLISDQKSAHFGGRQGLPGCFVALFSKTISGFVKSGLP